jgi:signal transduction histidine kinase
MEVIQRLGPQPATNSSEEMSDALRGHTEIDAPLYYFQVERLGTDQVFRSRNLGNANLPDLAERGPQVEMIELQNEPLRLRERTYEGYRIKVATNLEQGEALVERYRHTLIVVLPALLVVSIGAGWLLATAAVRPVRAMQRSASEITASNLSQRLPVPAGRDEIADLARLLNGLFARLEAAFEQVKRFTADASHELKTPLSLIRLHAERLAQSPRLGDADRAEVEGQIEEIARLNKLVENLLLLARADAGGLPLERRWQNPAPFIRDLAEDAQVLSEDRGLSFHLAQNDEAEVNFDPVMVRHVALNILTNSLRYTPAGRAIHLSSTVVKGTWHLVIEDEGPGVPPEQIDRIFGRFMRGPRDEEFSSEGSGLGLAIARSMVEAHGGTISAENCAGGGLRVNVQLPGARAGVTASPMA